MKSALFIGFFTRKFTGFSRVFHRFSSNSVRFGCIPGSSTAHALINLMHKWNTVWIFAVDYRKAFDLIDHSRLLSKLLAYNINPYIINWILAFLKDRKQRVQVAHDCLSEWGSAEHECCREQNWDSGYSWL